MTLKTRGEIKLEIREIISDLKDIRRRLLELADLIPSKSNDIKSLIIYLSWVIQALEERF